MKHFFTLTFLLALASTTPANQPPNPDHFKTLEDIYQNPQGYFSPEDILPMEKTRTFEGQCINEPGERTYSQIVLNLLANAQCNTLGKLFENDNSIHCTNPIKIIQRITTFNVKVNDSFRTIEHNGSRYIFIYIPEVHCNDCSPAQYCYYPIPADDPSNGKEEKE